MSPSQIDPERVAIATYDAFGFRLECDLELPELVEAPPSGEAAWHIAVRERGAPTGDFTEIGSEVVYADVRVRALASTTAFRLVFDDTGTFDVVAGEKRITWYPSAGANAPAVRADLLGRVIAIDRVAAQLVAWHSSARAPTAMVAR